jgi:hypothetical protein
MCNFFCNFAPEKPKKHETKTQNSFMVRALAATESETVASASSVVLGIDPAL